MVEALPDAESTRGAARPGNDGFGWAVIGACKGITGAGSEAAAESISADERCPVGELRGNVYSFGGDIVLGED